jgi:MATE family multidrug resistance protein
MDDASIKYIFKLSIPIFFANLAIPLVGIVDTALMGNLEKTNYLTATSIASNFFSMLFWSFGFLRMGTVGMVSSEFGKDNFDGIYNIFLRNLIFVIFISLIVILFQIYLLKICLNIFELEEQTKNLFEEYFKIRIYSAPGELSIYIITGLFVGLRKTFVSSLAVGVLSLLNIIISFYLVVYKGLNIEGVAYGTLISSYITSIVFIIYTFKYLGLFIKLRINFSKILNFRDLKKIFNINFNIFIRTILLTFSFFWFTYSGNKIGEDYVAANAILLNLIFLSSFFLDAYAFSSEGIVGYSLGKNNINLFKQVLKNSFILSSFTGLSISLLYLLTNEIFINLMTDIEVIRNLSFDHVIWLIVFPFFASFCYQFDGIFIGASQTVELRNSMIISVGAYLIFTILLIKSYGNTGLWISLLLFMIIRALTLFYNLKKIFIRFK